ncbi:MAG TPA: choice-of-anchor Q domain-containing protein [Candidatus Sulfomarinibacteraceae bacterium]|nr:choice-of-anchor Q domain-containing protein [Candidatus Sulfomarinibacteraceae bacterium]
MALESSGHNLADDTSCGFDTVTGDVITTQPGLAELADNGGPTLTHALLAGSPAIDAGHPAICPQSDQRGVARPLDGNGDGLARCDIGAFEKEREDDPDPDPDPEMNRRFLPLIIR